MNILFLGTVYNEENLDEIIENSKSPFNFASHQLQKNIIKGLDLNTGNNVQIINLLSVGRFPKHYKKALLKTYYWSHNGIAKDKEIGGINIQPFKNVYRIIKLKKEIKTWIAKNPENKYILIYDVYPIILKAIQTLGKDIKIILIVPDLPGENNFTGKNNLKTRILKFRFKKVNKLYTRINGFIFISKYMAEKFPSNIKNQVIEGMINSDIGQVKVIENNKKTIFYGGSLHLEYGIIDLVNAFSKIKNSTYELIICGSGNAESQIKNLAKKDERIIFKGLVKPSEFEEMMQNSNLLINPRNAKKEFTKYSFPSKTLYYMLSGVPVCMYKLKGIPEEYNKYLNYFDNNDLNSMANKIDTILKNNSYYLEKSKKARKFILEHKNSKVQTKKIIEMFLEI